MIPQRGRALGDVEQGLGAPVLVDVEEPGIEQWITVIAVSSRQRQKIGKARDIGREPVCAREMVPAMEVNGGDRDAESRVAKSRVGRRRGQVVDVANEHPVADLVVSERSPQGRADRVRKGPLWNGAVAIAPDGRVGDLRVERHVASFRDDAEVASRRTDEPLALRGRPRDRVEERRDLLRLRRHRQRPHEWRRRRTRRGGGVSERRADRRPAPAGGKDRVPGSHEPHSDHVSSSEHGVAPFVAADGGKPGGRANLEGFVAETGRIRFCNSQSITKN